MLESLIRTISGLSVDMEMLEGRVASWWAV